MKPTRLGEEEDKVVDSSSIVSPNQRLEFNMQKVKDHIENRAIKVLWEKSYLCPCRTETGSPDPLCQLCHGRGIAYLPAVDTKVTIQSQEKGVTSMDLALFDSGTAIGTSDANEDITFRDRLSIPDVDIGNSLIFRVTKNRIRNGFFIPYDVKELQFVTIKGRKLVANEDYTFDTLTNKFHPKEHLLNDNVSINVRSVLRYYVTDILKDARYQYTNKTTALEDFDNLPKKLLLKREDIFVEPFYFLDDEGNEPPVEIEPKREANSKTGSSRGFFGGTING